MLRVLVVEGDAGLTDMMVELLAREDSAVTIVSNLADAVPRLRGGHFDMVILDPDTVSLNPEANVLAAWRSLLAVRSSLPLFAVVSVHSSSESQLPQGLLPGKDQEGGSQMIWLQKPFRNHEFLSVVRAVPVRSRVEAEEKESQELGQGSAVAYPRRRA